MAASRSFDTRTRQAGSAAAEAVAARLVRNAGALARFGQPERGVDRPQRLAAPDGLARFQVGLLDRLAGSRVGRRLLGQRVLLDQHADLDVAGGDHLHVHAVGGRAPRTSARPRRRRVRIPAPTTETLLTLPLSISVAPRSAGDRRERLLGLLQVGVQHREADAWPCRRCRRSGRSCPRRCSRPPAPRRRGG